MIIKHDFIFIVLVCENNRDDAHNNKYNNMYAKLIYLNLRAPKLFEKLQIYRKI